MFGCFTKHKKSQSEGNIPLELQLLYTIREKKYSSKSLIKEEENQKLEVKLSKENLDIYKESLDKLANKVEKSKLYNFEIIEKTLNNENSLFNNYTIHIRSLITGLKNKLYDYEVKLDEKISEDNDKSLADDHIFFLKNLFMSKESKIMHYNHIIENIRNKKSKNRNFELEIKEKDEYYFNEILRYEREKMNYISKNLNHELIRKEKLTNEIKSIKSIIDKIREPNKPAEVEIKTNTASSKSSILPTTLASSNNILPIKQDNEKVKSDKMEEIEKLKLKIKINDEKMDNLNRELLLTKKEFTILQEELYNKNEEMSNKFTEIYDLELKLDKIKLKGKRRKIKEVFKKEEDCNL